MQKKLIFVGSLMMLMSSCTIYHGIQITGNPMGTKEGKAATKFLSLSQDISVKKAAENGKIKSIGAVEIKQKYFILPWTVTKVYGE
jgi:hypothetical protein